MQPETQKEKEEKNTEKGIREFRLWWKKSNLHVIQVIEGKEINWGRAIFG